MADKKKTLSLKNKAENVADKAVDDVKEQPIAQEKAVEQKPQPAPEPKAETPVQPEHKPQGIATSDKDGINVENKGDQIIITYPNRKDINYAFNDGAVGMKNSVVKWDKAPIHDKLFDKEPLQTKTVAYNATDLTPDTMGRLSKAIDTARTVNSEYRAERDTAKEYFNEIANGKELKIYGTPFKKVEIQGRDTEYRPSYFNGDIVKVGKHLIAAVEGSTDKATYVRLLETSKLPLDARAYADKEKAAKNHLGIKDENTVKATINGKEQEVIKDAKRHISFNSDWEVSKVSAYESKPEQAKTKRVANTMAV